MHKKVVHSPHWICILFLLLLHPTSKEVGIFCGSGFIKVFLLYSQLWLERMALSDLNRNPKQFSTNSKSDSLSSCPPGPYPYIQWILNPESLQRQHWVWIPNQSHITFQDGYMVFIIDLNSEIVAHVRSFLCHLIRSRAVTSWIFFLSEKTLFYFMHAKYVLSYLLI